MGQTPLFLANLNACLINISSRSPCTINFPYCRACPGASARCLDLSLLQLFHLFGELGYLGLLIGIGAEEFFGGVGQCFDGDGELVFFHIDVIDLHHHDLRDFFGVADEASGVGLFVGLGFLGVDFCFLPVDFCCIGLAGFLCWRGLGGCSFAHDSALFYCFINLLCRSFTALFGSFLSGCIVYHS